MGESQRIYGVLVPSADFLDFSARLAKVIHADEAHIARSYRNCVTIGAESDRLKREVCADPLYDDLVIYVIKDDVLVEAYTSEEQLV